MDKFDDAIAWLREQDGNQGSYFEEVACLIEELLGRVHELEAELAPEPPPRPEDELQRQRMIALGKSVAAKRAAWFAAQRSSAIDDKE